MKKIALLLSLALLLAAPGLARAGFTETAPQGTWLLDISYVISHLNSMWNNRGESVPLIDQMIRYEPGAGKQGILTPEPDVEFRVLALQLYYGILDNLIVGVGLPLIIYTDIDPNLQWEEGDWQWNLGRAYSESDFWEWAESMGQPKPGQQRINEWTPGDVQIGMRFRFSDYFSGFEKYGWAMSAMFSGALPTGKQADPEEVIAAGTTSWDLHMNGDLGIHGSVDKMFPDSLDGRLGFGLDLFYEWLLPHRYLSPQGEKNPLMLNYRPFTGKYYTIDGGDFSGFSVQTDIVPIKGPVLTAWLTGGDVEAARKLPPLLTLNLRYTYLHLQQTNWESNSDIWDWEREKLWRPGYKNILTGQAVLSLLKFGVPMQPYVTYRNLTWIPGKNSRAVNAMMFGSRLLMKFW